MTGTTSTRAGAYLAELFDVQNRIAVVIGGTSGLGEAAAVALGRCGARVVVAGRDNDRAEGVVRRIAELEGEASAHFVDVLDEASVGRLADEVHASHGAVDILVNAAGVFAMEPSAELTLERWSRIIDTNLTGTFLCCRAFGRRMLEAGRGRIINFASTDSFVGVPEEAAYCASKGGVLQLTRVLGAEWIKHGVRVNAIGPDRLRHADDQAVPRRPRLPRVDHGRHPGRSRRPTRGARGSDSLPRLACRGHGRRLDAHGRRRSHRDLTTEARMTATTSDTLNAHLERNAAAGAELADQVREAGVEFIYYQFVSLTGRVLAKLVPAEHLARNLERGVQFFGAAVTDMAVGRDGALIASGPEREEFLAIPDASTFAVLPWDRSFGRFICNLYRRTDARVEPGTPLATCVRHNLQRAHAAFRADTGLQLRSGTEPEMSWFGDTIKPWWNDATDPSYHYGALEQMRPIVKRVIAYGQAMGLTMIEGDYEDNAQIELNFAYDDCELTCDRLLTYRQICMQVATEFGVTATFMPKPRRAPWPTAVTTT